MGKAVSASLAVNLFLLGPMLYFYFEIPPYSVFLNLFVIPALPVIMGTGLSGSVMILLVKPIGIILLTITCRLLCDIVRVIWNVSAFSKENMGVYAFCFGGVFDCFMRSKNPGY